MTRVRRRVKRIYETPSPNVTMEVDSPSPDVAAVFDSPIDTDTHTSASPSPDTAALFDSPIIQSNTGVKSSGKRNRKKLFPPDGPLTADSNATPKGVGQVKIAGDSDGEYKVSDEEEADDIVSQRKVARGVVVR